MARPQGWGWFVLRYMGMVAQFCSDDSHFSDFQSDWLPILYLNTVRLTHSFCRKKIGISLSHLVPEIPVPKDGLLFHQDGLFGRFKTFRINFPLPFLYYWPPFSLILNLLTPHFHKTLDLIGSIFFTCWTRVPKIYWSIPSPPQHSYDVMNDFNNITGTHKYASLSVDNLCVGSHCKQYNVIIANSW